jgi:predicted MPP superfamily phosphohydrolase
MAPSSSASRPLLTRRRLLQGGLLGAAGLALYSAEVERHWTEVTHTDAHLHGLPDAFDGLRIVQLSDIHMDSYTEPFFLRHIVKMTNDLRPDLVFLTGDFVSDGPQPAKFAVGAAWQCANILKEINCRAQYAVMGNHDVAVGEKEITEALTTNGITVLNNACIPIERGGSKIWLAGLDDPVNGDPRPDRAIPDSIRNIAHEPVVLMCHAPDYADTLMADASGRAVALMLSGHTHGGQVRLPFVGPLTLPGLGRKYVEGWFRFGAGTQIQPDGMQLYVNRGIGTVAVPFRFDCPPEITAFTLRRSESSS